ncbi:PREDICTED: uncharacterized protein LOC108689076 [Atta colombica]|uniref:uncharacterized protein LOC108689076 n=1 Tax=Atta colombica TaxID=520822 RepID=UPI00084C071C|nr:PREDICTED: uncharacterized protein LOC108689076 [Atta colombica]
MNDFSHTSLIIFFILHFGVFVARYQNTRHATPNTTEVGSKYSGSMSSSSQCIRTTTAASFLFKKLQSHENRDTATVKWASERDSTESGPRVAGNIFCSHRAILGRVFVRSFSMARRNYESSEGAPGPDAGVLTAAVHDEVSRSRFLERRVSSRFNSRETGLVFPCLAANGGDGEKKREDAALSS